MGTDDENKMETEDGVADSDFTSRHYQDELLSIAIQENTILYLPTGSGKTFIATMLIKAFSSEIEKQFSKGGKRAFFLVNTVALVGQQGAAIQRHSCFNVGQYSGDLNIDLWTHERWLEELEDNSVIVMTAQILLNMLQHSYIRLPQIKVIVFDECHRGVKDHPMRNIMRYFENVPEVDQPRVLGLTGSLLNATIKVSQVTAYIREIETTFLSRIITAKDDEMAEQISCFSTDPREELVQYCSEKQEGMPFYIKCKNEFEELKMFVKNVFLTEEYEKPARPNPGCIEISDDYKLNKKLCNMIDDILFQMSDLGMYGGFKATLAHVIQLERLKRTASSAVLASVYQVLITSFTLIRKYFAQTIADYSTQDAVLMFSSRKVLCFIELLRDVKPEDSVIVFVERRFTCKVLLYILQDLKKANYLPNVNADFIVGYNNNPFNDTREGVFEKKINKDVLRKFNEGETNVLIASDVLEEGIDVQSCNLVVKYDPPKTARSYIQSKGRARNRESRYYIFVDKVNSKFTINTYLQYKELEDRLRKELVGKFINRSKPTQEELNETIFYHSIEPFYPEGPDGPMLAGAAAISLVNRYCTSLIVDYFTKLTPYWWKESKEICGKELVTVSLQLPNSSPVRETITGGKYPNLDLAKRSAAIKACKLLYEYKELDSHLLPRGRSSEQMEDSEMFPNWEDERAENKCEDEAEEKSNEDDQQFLPGTKKRKQLYMKKYPDCLCSCRPTQGVTVYMHLIHMKPNYPRPTESRRKAAFFDILKTDNTFAILSSKPLPKVAEFPLFMSTGEVRISISPDAATTKLTKKQINDLIDFHSLIFTDIVLTVHPFMYRDYENLEQSYLFAPVKPVSNNNVDMEFELDWDVIINNKSLPPIEPLSEEERSNIKVNDETYYRRVVVPWYRGFAPRQAYIVTAVSEDENAHAPFPSDEFDDYVEYFTNKYASKVTKMYSPDEMLLEVRAVSSRLNCLKPRGASKGTSKKRRKEEEEFEETLVAELCIKYDFPGIYWLKATLLPSISHRLTHLLLAEELKERILSELVRDINISVSHSTEPEVLRVLEVDHMSMQEQDEELVAPPNSTTKTVTIKPKSTLPISEPVYPWGDEQEPIDFQRNIDDVKLIDIYFYDDFISKPLVSTKRVILEARRKNDILKYNGENIYYYCLGEQNLLLKQKLIQLQLFKPCKKFCSKHCVIDVTDKPLTTFPMKKTQKNFLVLNEPAPSLSVLQNFKKSDLSLNVQQGDVLQALTAASAHDVFSLERLETLGDSFLKYSVSLILYLSFPKLTEGQLTNIKGKIIGNRNLYYCGKKLNLASIMKVTEFNTDCDWVTPGFCIDRKLQQVMRSITVNPRFLYSFNLTKEEQTKGKLSQDTLDQIEVKLLESQEETDVSNATFLSQQLVSDKTIADCVEALLGLYIKNCGLEAGFHLLRLLGVTKRKLINADVYKKGPVPSSRLTPTGNIEFHLHQVNILEQLIGYKFKDRAFLLQALSHPTYQPNNITPTYQRLEFLGDAILDLLITCHIFETCSSKLMPGELTDLRSALVNNITLATIAVRIGLHKFLLMRSCKLSEVIDNFVSRQEDRHHQVDDQVLFLLEEGNIGMAEAVEVPKVLGDIFESIVAAIFLDSGKCLQTTWNFIYKFMKDEIRIFSASVPKNHVRQLFEENVQVKFRRSHVLEEYGRVMVPVMISYNGECKTFHGFGETKSQAKRAAAKLALRHIRRS